MLLLEEIKDKKPESSSSKTGVRVKMEQITATWGFLKSSKNGDQETNNSDKDKNVKVEESNNLREPLLQNVESD